jgi:hypothetical protein
VAEPDVREPSWPRVLRSPWTLAWIVVALAGVFAAAVIRPDTSGVTLPVAVAVFLGIVAAEWLSLDFEFRRHGFSCSASELAFVIALVELGGTWTVLIRAAAFGTVLVLQRFSAPKVLFNVAVAAIEVCVAVAVLQILPPGGIDEPATWLSYLLAIVTATSVGALLIAGAVVATQGYPGRTLWTSLFIPVVLVGPASVLVGDPPADRGHSVGVAADRSAGPGAGVALPTVRRGDPRRADAGAGLRLRPAGGAGHHRRRRRPADRPGAP